MPHDTIVGEIAGDAFDLLFVRPLAFIGSGVVGAARTADDAQQNFFLGVSKELRGDIPSILEEDIPKSLSVAENFGRNVALASVATAEGVGDFVAAVPGKVFAGLGEGIKAAGPEVTAFIVALLALGLAAVVVSAIVALRIF